MAKYLQWGVLISGLGSVGMAAGEGNKTLGS